jgi:uncharacterized protein
MSLLATIAGLATGLALELFGSGGSIIALPALLYLLHVDPKSAIAMSLGVVAVTSTVSGLDNWHRGLVDVRVALVFGLFGVAGTFAGARLGLLTPVVLQLGLFALVMYAAWRMLKPAKLVAAASGGIVNAGGGTAYHGARWHTATKSGNFTRACRCKTCACARPFSSRRARRWPPCLSEVRLSGCRGAD